MASDNNPPDYDPSRRKVLQTLLAAGITGSALSKTAVTARGQSSNDQVELNDLDYHFDHDIPRFSGDNVTTTGAVRYEQKKYAADPSFFTWQSGSWINTGGPSRNTNLTNIWAPGAKHSTLEIGKDSTKTSLNLGQTYAYTDKQQDDEFPQAAYQQYAFDLVWYALDQGIPYSLPPAPPVVLEDSNETSIDAGPSGASITYFDPTPPIEETSYSATHSADWRWDASGGLDPGWNYTYANRETDVGEYLWDSTTGWTFEQDAHQHQLSLSTAFCIYQEDESVCDTPECPNCIQSIDANAADSSMQTMSTSGEEIKSNLQSCCTLETVTRPISVSSEHLKSAKEKARSNAKPFLDNPRTQFAAEAARGWEQASKMETDFRSLVAYRSASAHGRGSGVRQNVFNGNINANNATNRTDQMVNKASATANNLRYTGNSLDAVIGEVGQIEKVIQSVISWADNAAKAFEVDHLSDGEKLKYAESGLEFSAGNLADAEHYIKNRKASGSQGTDQSDALQSLYNSLHQRITGELSDVSSDLSDHVAYARYNAVSHKERAEDRKSNEYLAAAVVDLLYAYGYASAIPALKSANFDDVDEEKLEVEQELTANRYNRRATGNLKFAERLLMRMASLEYNSGIESFGTFRAMNDQTEAEQAFRHAIVTEEFLNATDTVYEKFNLT